ncbi:MAG: SAVED domain-containing protein [Agitococcus sp.]|nr:SAVED domain-containing protein [Agitococcus sp.]
MPTVLAISQELPAALPDEQLGLSIQTIALVGGSFCVIADAFHGAICKHNVELDAWEVIGLGDIGASTVLVLEGLIARGKITWCDKEKLDDALVHGTLIEAVSFKKAQLKKWCSRRDKLTGVGEHAGRQGEVLQETRDEVARLAAWRCQFAGCGEDLRFHAATRIRGNFSYYAHIVASSPDGPRGDANLSQHLANSPDNIMLLCDKCHRFIDRVDPKGYTRERLTQMREDNIQEVNRLLSSLTYKSTEMLVIGGNISGQNFHFDRRVAEEAMWLQKLRCSTPKPECFFHNGILGDATKPHYWQSIFDSLTTEIPRIRAYTSGASQGGAAPGPLAIFPLHSMSLLTLSGRLIGEARSTHLFQFNRDAVAGSSGGQWAWPISEIPSEEKFKINVLQEHKEGITEAVLLIFLTSKIQRQDLPANWLSGEGWTHPTIEITVDHPYHGTISHPNDLEHVGRAFDHALRKLQEEWQVDRIHCLQIAPASACVRFGQKLQAKFHRPIRLYEREQYKDSSLFGAFVPTIDINATEVSLADTDRRIPIA